MEKNKNTNNILRILVSGTINKIIAAIIIQISAFNVSGYSNCDTTKSFSKFDIEVGVTPCKTSFKSPGFGAYYPLPDYNNHIFSTGLIGKMVAEYNFNNGLSIRAGILYSIQNGRNIYEPKNGPNPAAPIQLTESNVNFYKMDYAFSEFLYGVKYTFLKKEHRIKPYVAMDLASIFFYKWERVNDSSNVITSGNSVASKFGEQRGITLPHLYMCGGGNVSLTNSISMNIEFCFSPPTVVYSVPYYNPCFLGIGLGVIFKIKSN